MSVRVSDASAGTGVCARLRLRTLLHTALLVTEVKRLRMDFRGDDQHLVETPASFAVVLISSRIERHWLTFTALYGAVNH